MTFEEFVADQKKTPVQSTLPVVHSQTNGQIISCETVFLGQDPNGRICYMTITDDGRVVPIDEL